MGGSYIRLDVEIAPIFEDGGAWRQQPDWSKLDDVVALSRRYGLPVVGILRSTPRQLSTCPTAADPGKCPPTDYFRYGHLAGQIAAHARGVIRDWEVLNEPDGSWAFQGSTGQYAWMLRRTYDNIKLVAPEDKVLLGGVMSPDSRGWLSRVFATPNADASHRFDIANVHLRGTLGFLRWGMARFHEFFACYGFRGPLWVTEHGYPGDTRFQPDPSYRGGETAQAGYLRQSLPTLVRAGARQVFVTLRDSTAAEFGDSQFASEGVTHIGSTSPYSIRRKAAFSKVRWLAGLWPSVPATRRDLHTWRVQLGIHRRLARRYKRLARRERMLVRSYRRLARRARIARLHEAKRRRYARRTRAQLRMVRHLRSLIAGYSEGP